MSAGRWVALAAVVLGAVLIAWAARATSAPARTRAERVALVAGLVLAAAGVAGAGM